MNNMTVFQIFDNFVTACGSVIVDDNRHTSGATIVFCDNGMSRTASIKLVKNFQENGPAHIRGTISVTSNNPKETINLSFNFSTSDTVFCDAEEDHRAVQSMMESIMKNYTGHVSF